MEPKQHQTASRRNGESGGRKSMGNVKNTRLENGRSYTCLTSFGWSDSERAKRQR